MLWDLKLKTDLVLVSSLRGRAFQRIILEHNVRAKALIPLPGHGRGHLDYCLHTPPVQHTFHARCGIKIHSEDSPPCVFASTLCTGDIYDSTKRQLGICR